MSKSNYEKRSQAYLDLLDGKIGGFVVDSSVLPQVMSGAGFKVGDLVRLNSEGLDSWGLNSKEEVDAQNSGVRIVRMFSDVMAVEGVFPVDLEPPFDGMMSTTDSIEKV